MTPSDLCQRKVMASKCSVDPCSKGQDVAETRLEKLQGKEKEETEVSFGYSRLAGCLRNDGPGREQQLSPGHIGVQVVTSASAVEQVPREETQTWKKKETFSHLSVNQENQSGGLSILAQRLRRSKRGDLSARGRERQIEEPRGPGPFYYFGGTNGAKIVSNYCESRGWKRIYNKDRKDFNLKWCETKSPAQYSNFREGKQLMYQIPNNKVLTTKIGLLSSLRQYEQVSSRVCHVQGLRRLKLEEFIPTTFRMDLREDREAFFAQQAGASNNESRMWICKPTSMNQGRGIFLLKSQEDIDAFRLKLQHMDNPQTNRKTQYRQPQAHVVQHYIQNPMLLKGKKFDVRSYLLIACTAPYMVFFRHGYVRLTCDLYDPNSKNLSTHLTNQYVQKKNPLYSQLKEDTVWSMESFNTYVNDRFQVAKDLPRDWVLGAFAKRMQQIMTQCFFAVKSQLDCRLGFFDLIGCDFLIDEDFKVWLLEMNCNPALHTNCEVLKEVIPSVVVETLDLTLEIFKKAGSRQKIFPLVSQREFVLLYSSSNPSPELQKTTKEPQKTKPRRCTSGTEVKGVPSAFPDNSVNVSALPKRRSRSMSGHRPPSTSQSHHESGASMFIQRQRNCCKNAQASS